MTEIKMNAKHTKGNGSLTYAALDKNGMEAIKGTGICTITIKVLGTDIYLLL